MEDFVLNCPERDEVVKEESELAYDSKESIEGLNWEAGVPLEMNAPYLIVEQLNTGRKYRNPQDSSAPKLTSKRFYAIQLTPDRTALTTTCRTIGVSALRGMHIGTTNAEAIKYDVKRNESGKLRAVGVKYYHACPDTSFIRGDVARMRAQIVRPVIVTPLHRGGVYTFEYNNETKDIKTVGTPAKALAAANDRFYTFNVEECHDAALVAKAKEALSKRDDFYNA